MKHPSIHTTERSGLPSCYGKMRVWVVYYACPWVLSMAVGFGGDRECGTEFINISIYMRKKDMPSPPHLHVNLSVSQFLKSVK